MSFWVAQQVKPLALAFCPGHDLRIVGSGTVSGCALNTKSAGEYLHLPLPLLLPHSFFLILK